VIWLWRTACFDFRGNSIQNQSALSGATATAATSAMLTAMPLCAMPRGRAGHGSAPWRATDASIWSLDWCRECAWVAETTVLRHHQMLVEMGVELRVAYQRISTDYISKWNDDVALHFLQLCNTKSTLPTATAPTVVSICHHAHTWSVSPRRVASQGSRHQCCQPNASSCGQSLRHMLPAKPQSTWIVQPTVMSVGGLLCKLTQQTQRHYNGLT
jgi:hypothetical protein